MSRTATSAATHPTINTAGALLPPDLIARLAAGDLDHLSPASYGLPDGYALRQAAARAWELLLPTYRSFQHRLAALPDTDPATVLTRDRWTTIVLRELGYDLKTISNIQVEDDIFDVRHLDGHVPVHMLGWNVELDKRASTNVRGASRSAPHSLIQELLNRTDRHLWAVLTNGRSLRLLRDNIVMGRPAYVEFDLEGMFTGEQFADFAVMFALAHATRIRSERPSDCILEQWRTTAINEGTRALDHLRDGVTQALRTLGTGFLEHPDNHELRDLVRSGPRGTTEYYRWLLRLAYRLIFLFVAEDRDLLHAKETSLDTRRWYAEHFSTSRLRRLAMRGRAGRHTDQWATLKLVFDALGGDGNPALGLPAYGADLFEAAFVGKVHDAKITNERFMTAVRSLAYLPDAATGTTRPVDYKNLGAEELGSVYEALLEFMPNVGEDGVTFSLSVQGGNARKTTGSYYTSKVLVDTVLQASLEPLLIRAMESDNPEAALLALTVCDPACGSGHFLVGAARRIARQLAIVRTGDPEPTQEAMQEALRDVIGRCIYGVDLNDLAAELAKIGLWLEALTPGKPLAFLDNHIKVGNGLLGTTPALLANNIPDDAYEPVFADDKTYARKIKQRNKAEREIAEAGQGYLLGTHEIHVSNSAFTSAFRSVEQDDADDIESLRKKADAWRRAEADPELQRARLVADAWCAAFVWPLTPDFNRESQPVTHETLLTLQESPDLVPLRQRRDAVADLAQHYKFFHWHLEFPQVFQVPEDVHGAENALGWNGGFSCMLGNPPWDTLSPDVKEFFSTYDPSIRQADKAAQRGIMEDLLQHSSLALAWDEYQRDLYATAHFLKRSGAFTMYATGSLGKGDFNVYRSFVERALRLIKPSGRASQIVPSGLYQGANAAEIRRSLLGRYPMRLLLGFVNLKKVWFPAIHSETRFCLYAADGSGEPSPFVSAFGLLTEADLTSALDRAETIDPELIRELVPVDLAISEGLMGESAGLIGTLTRQHPAFGDPTRPERPRHQREIDMGNDRDLLRPDTTGLPVYEGRMVAPWDYRAKEWISGRGRSAVWEDLDFGDVEKRIAPQWTVARKDVPKKIGNRVERYRIGFCDVTSPQTDYPLTATLIPPGTIAGHKVPVITFDPAFEWAYLPWLAVANSLVINFLARRRVTLTMSLTILDSLPFPVWEGPEDPRVKAMSPIAADLALVGPDMEPFRRELSDIGLCAPKAPAHSDDTQWRLRAASALHGYTATHVFGLTDEQVRLLVRESEPTWKSERRTHGEAKTPLLIEEYLHAGRPTDLLAWVAE